MEAVYQSYMILQDVTPLTSSYKTRPLSFSFFFRMVPVNTLGREFAVRASTFDLRVEKLGVMKPENGGSQKFRRSIF